MFKVVYTMSLDDADEVVAESWEYEDLKIAIKLFKECINKIIADILDNSLLCGKISIHHNKAIIKVESRVHVIAIVDDMNKPVRF